MDPVYFLLVDDLEDNLLSLEALLRREGLVLLKARSGEEALELMLVHEIALGLLDVQMPGMDGFELAELMRGNERTRHIPIIFLTASASDNQRNFRGYEAGAVDFIQKPIEWDILRSKANVFFELHRQRQQIAAQRDKLEVYAQKLATSDRYKDQFLAILAHELRNPMTPLRVGLDILKSDPSPERAVRIHDVMDRQLVHLVRLVDDLLDVSRVSQGKIVLKREDVDIAEIIQSAIESTRPLIDAGKHEFRINLEPLRLRVNGDRIRLAQVVGNLLSNAAKYTPAGGALALDVYQEKAHVVIVVRDNGMGIPLAMQSSIFELFTQVGEHIARAQGGLGIGLALVKQFVAMHDGSITVNSAGEGAGSSFTVRLPLLMGMPDEATTNEGEGASIQAPHLKVLVVDDNLDVAQTIGWLLGEMGHEYQLVHDGRMACDAARKFKPDAVLLDLGMPVMDGFSVCRSFRQDQSLRHISLIAQSGWGQGRDKEESAKAGFDYHLVKPVNYADLQRVLALASESKRVDIV